MRYLGLDLSLDETGWYSFENEVGEGGVFKQPTKAGQVGTRLSDAERLAWFYANIGELLDNLKPDRVAIEGYSMGSKGRLANLGELGGIVRLLLQQRRIPTICVPPANVKQFVNASYYKKMLQDTHPTHLPASHTQLLNRAKCDKKKYPVLIGILSEFNEQFTNDNIADAFILSQMARAQLDSSYLSTSKQKAAIKKVKLIVTPRLDRTRVRSRNLKPVAKKISFSSL